MIVDSSHWLVTVIRDTLARHLISAAAQLTQEQQSVVFRIFDDQNMKGSKVFFSHSYDGT
jgi:hypothetical protein